MNIVFAFYSFYHSSFIPGFHLALDFLKQFLVQKL